MDIFGHCIACATWKSCCWKNIDPLCIAKQDGCHVIKEQAEKELAAKEVFIILRFELWKFELERVYWN